LSDTHSLKSRIRILVSDASGVILEKEFNEFPISFGRNPSSQILLPFEFVSRSHCVLVEEDDGIALIDMHSSHGIFVDDKKVERINIQDGLTFKIKDLSIQVIVLGERVEQDTLKTVIQTPTKSNIAVPVNNSALPPTILTGKTPASQMTKLRQHDENTPVSPAKVPQAAPIPAKKRGVIIPAATAAPPAAPSDVPKIHHMPSPQMGMPMVVSDFGGIDRIPMVEKDFRPLLMSAHPAAQQARFRKIEASITWHDVIYDIQEFDPTDKISVGPLGKADMVVPIFRRPMVVAKVGTDKTKCFALKDHKISVSTGQSTQNAMDLMEKNILNQKGQKYIWNMGIHDVTTMDFGSGIQLHLRYVPGTKALSRVKMIEPDEAIKQSLIGSAILHVALSLIIFVIAPAGRVGPNLKNVPQRYARLLVEKPKPKPTPPPPPKEVAKKEPPKPVEKVVQKKQKPMKLPKILAKKNKFPIEVKHPIAKAPPPVKVEALGALGALGAMSKVATNQVTNININPNAGGLPQKAINTGGIAGALPSSNGKLAAGGGPRVKTKGFGYGTGTGYGMQGLKGTAGTRGVAGAVVGEPKLASMAKMEGLSREQVMSVLKQYMGEVQHCYERNLLANPDLAGRIDFEWDIAPSGKVTDVRVKRSTVNNGDGLVECVRKVFAGMPFPKAKNGMITTPTIGFPFGRI
jgi:pSer/pThr/pTyr-binding forkhead associated (FHA) protein